MPKATETLIQGDRSEIVHGLKRARWSLAEASENAGLAARLCSADCDWLQSLRRELTELRREIRCLVHEFEERKQEAQPAAIAGPSAS